MSPVPLDCTASLMPLPGLPLAAEIQCPVCGRRVSVRGPPPEGFKDPWQGSTDNRISPHWSRKMQEVISPRSHSRTVVSHPVEDTVPVRQ